MKIGIDANTLAIPFPCGIKNYSEMLINNLAKHDKKNNYYLFAKKNVKIPSQKNFHLIKMPNIPIISHQMLLPYYANKEKVDIFHYLEPYGSVFFNHKKIITTVHDIDLNATYPKFSKYFVIRFLCEVTRNSVFKKTKIFITNSYFTKKKLIHFLVDGSKKSSISNIYLACNPLFYKLGNKYHSKKNYLLCMGDFTPRKNISRIIEAFSMLPKNFKNKHLLKIVSSTHESANKFINCARKYGILEYTEVLINLSLDDLISVYCQAIVFIYPSLYEGFGMPILEAMSCRCPVITSKIGAMLEISGDAAYHVNPFSTKDIRKAILKITNSSKLQNNLDKKAQKIIKKYSWEKTSRETQKLYSKLYLK